MNAPELQREVKVSIALIVGLVVAAFSLGGVVASVLRLDSEIQRAMDYTEQEVGGLRADWERRNSEVEKRLDRLENN